ncbi:MAG: 50S ribosomal protein L15 [SAR324 cluster bacterium]|nr:50S ribosomal protein L15 [SAR324 cluster bacterium]
MQLHNLEKPEGSTKPRKRIGRGPGSGTGKTCGRGHKGYKSRSGAKRRRGFEGGQMPIHRRLPKFGFTNIFRIEYTIINLSTLDKLGDFDASDVITKEILQSKKIIRNLKHPVKLLGNGDLSKAVKIQVDKASQSAMEKVKAAGGEVLLLK